MSRFRKKNRKAVDELEKAGIYDETIRNIVEELGILSPRQMSKDSHFVFQTIDGAQRTPNEIVQRLARQELSVNNTENGIHVDVGPLVDDRRARSKVSEVDIKSMVRPNTSMPGWSPQTMSSVDNTDAIHRARFLPDLVDVTDAGENIRRAQNIGYAEASGDSQAMFDANTMYDFSYQDAEEVGDRVLIGNQTLNNFLAKKGLPGERLEKLIDPATGKRVLDMPKEEQRAYFRKRGVEGTQRWMNTGGRSIGDGNTEVFVPGLDAQMEHVYPFSGSIDELGVGNSQYFSDDKFNQGGYYERYENAEKNDISPQDYHRARRAQMLAQEAGIEPLELGKTVSGRQAAESMIADRLPAVVYSNARLKKDREADIDLDAAANGLELMRLTNQLYQL